MNAIELLQSMVAIRSLSGQEEELARHLVQRMSAQGIESKIDAAGNAIGVRCGSRLPGEGIREIVLLGHMDTVAGDVPRRREGDLLHGRGAVDAKGALAAFICAVARITPAPGARLVVAGAVEEESATSRGARHIASGHRPQACIIGEPSGWDGLTLGYKGRLLFDYRLQLPCGHSAGPAPSAPEGACAFWQELQSLCAHFNAKRPRLADQILPALQSLHSSSDGLADRACARISLRLPAAIDTSELRARITELAGAGQLAFRGEDPAHSSARTSPLARAFQRAFAQAGVRPRFKHKTGTSDMNVVGPIWRCPIVAYGPGDARLDHAPDEHISLGEYERAIAILERALCEAGFALPA